MARKPDRYLDSLRGLLRKRQNERKQAILDGYDEAVVAAWFDPKIISIEEQIRALQSGVNDEDNEDYYGHRNANVRRRRR